MEVTTEDPLDPVMEIKSKLREAQKRRIHLLAEEQEARHLNDKLRRISNVLVDQILYAQGFNFAIDLPKLKGKVAICPYDKDGRSCKSKAIHGTKYCWHHAPLDPESGYVYCGYSEGKKNPDKTCQNPVAKNSGITLCKYHLSLEAGPEGSPTAF